MSALNPILASLTEAKQQTNWIDSHLLMRVSDNV